MKKNKFVHNIKQHIFWKNIDANYNGTVFSSGGTPIGTMDMLSVGRGTGKSNLSEQLWRELYLGEYKCEPESPIVQRCLEIEGVACYRMSDREVSKADTGCLNLRIPTGAGLHIIIEDILNKFENSIIVDDWAMRHNLPEELKSRFQTLRWLDPKCIRPSSATSPTLETGKTDVIIFKGGLSKRYHAYKNALPTIHRISHEDTVIINIEQ